MKKTIPSAATSAPRRRGMAGLFISKVRAAVLQGDAPESLAEQNAGDFCRRVLGGFYPSEIGLENKENYRETIGKIWETIGGLQLSFMVVDVYIYMYSHIVVK